MVVFSLRDHSVFMRQLEHMRFFIKYHGLYHKLLLGYLLMLVIMALPCAVSIYSLTELDGFATGFARDDVELTTTIEYLKGLHPSMEAEGRRLVTLYKEDAYQSLLSLTEDFQEKIVTIQKYGPLALRTAARDIEINLTELIYLAHKSQISQPEDKHTQITPVEAQREEEVKTLTLKIMADLNKLEIEAKKDLRNKASQISNRSSGAKRLTLFLSLGALAFALIAPWFLYKYIKQPIDFLRRGTEIIGQGRFDQTIPVVSHDELGELAEAFNKMAERLKELDALKSDFIAVASHELRTPLAAMVEAAKLLAEPQIGTLNENQGKLVSVLNESMARFQGLIDELLHLSRLKAKLVALEKRPRSLQKILAEITQTLGPMAREKGITFLLPPEPPAEPVPVDEERIFRAFMNILHNAVKFSHENDDIKIVLDIFFEKGKKWLKVGIIDAGLGIEKTEHEKIFDKFYQIQAMRKKDGSGLGLAIAREIILAHGGKIWVESPPSESAAVVKGQGAAFWSLLPYSS